MTPVFDSRLVRLRRARAARGFETEAFLHRRVAEDLADRVETVNRRFSRALVLGAPSMMSAVLNERPRFREQMGAAIGADWSAALAGSPPSAACDKERLPFADESFDLILSNLVLHHVDDLPGMLVQIRRALKPDGLFIGAMWGGDTLQELRSALLAAESEVRGGAAMRVGPFATLKDLAGLLQRAGFALPVADNDRVCVQYAGLRPLVRDLRAMGETNVLADRGPPITRALLHRAEALYARDHGDGGRRLAATFEIITMTGWKPHASQPQPLARGSAKVSMAQVFGGIGERGD